MPARSFCFIAESKCRLDSQKPAFTQYGLRQKKSVGITLVTRPTHRGSGIALLVETSNAEAHADMYINEYNANNRHGLPAYNQSDITYPWTSTVALNLTNNSKLPDFYVPRTKRQVNAFTFCQSSIPTHSPLFLF